MIPVTFEPGLNEIYVGMWSLLVGYRGLCGTDILTCWSVVMDVYGWDAGSNCTEPKGVSGWIMTLGAHPPPLRWLAGSTTVYDRETYLGGVLAGEAAGNQIQGNCSSTRHMPTKKKKINTHHNNINDLYIIIFNDTTWW